MNSEINKASEPHILILKPTDKLDLRRGEDYCLIKSLHLLHIEKHKNLIQQQ